MTALSDSPTKERRTDDEYSPVSVTTENGRVFHISCRLDSVNRSAGRIGSRIGILLFLIVCSAIVASPTGWSHLGLVLTIVLSDFAFQWQTRRWQRRLLSRLKREFSLNDDEIHGRLESIIAYAVRNHGKLAAGEFIPVLCDFLGKCGLRDCVFYLNSADADLVDSEPLRVPFEPLTFGEGATLVNALDEKEPDRTTFSQILWRSTAGRKGSQFSQWTIFLICLVFVASAVLGSLGFVLWQLFTFIAYGSTSNDLFWAELLLATIGSAFFAVISQPYIMFCAPACVIARRRSWLMLGPKSRYWTRQNSILIVCRDAATDVLHAAVADADRAVDIGLMHKAGGQFFIRAWMSPLPPPTDEMLREFI